jgi:hypothetical protein
MASSLHRNIIPLLIACTSVILGCAKNSNKLLADRELLAIVAGNALNENIVNEIDSRGLAFHPSDAYRGQRNVKGRPFWSRVWVLASTPTERNALNG